MSDQEPEDVERIAPQVRTVDDIGDEGDIGTTEDVQGIETIQTPTAEGDIERGGRPRLPDEDEYVNTVGGYESWNQSGQGLDAVGSGMTGDTWSDGMTGTGFEDDTDLDRGQGEPEEKRAP